ncbi:MAG: hypothetical protein IH892_12345, partial [Planctomycetes bacterium]|nr:hypothetical protein [Planctomycetota bacterium]
YFVNTYARESQRYIKELDPTMLEIFANYSWPGNVRQLRNVVRTSLILGAGETLSLADVYWLFDGVPQAPVAEGTAMEGRAPDIQVAAPGAGLGLGSMLGCVGKPDLASSGPSSAWPHPAPSTIEQTSPASPSLPGEKIARSRANDGVFRQSLGETEDLGGLSLDVVERRAIIDTLRKTAGNRKKAAEVLGISDRTLRERIRRYKEQECLVPT